MKIGEGRVLNFGLGLVCVFCLWGNEAHAFGSAPAASTAAAPAANPTNPALSAAMQSAVMQKQADAAAAQRTWTLVDSELLYSPMPGYTVRFMPADLKANLLNQTALTNPVDLTLLGIDPNWVIPEQFSLHGEFAGGTDTQGAVRDQNPDGVCYMFAQLGALDALYIRNRPDSVKKYKFPTPNKTYGKTFMWTEIFSGEFLQTMQYIGHDLTWDPNKPDDKNGLPSYTGENFGRDPFTVARDWGTADMTGEAAFYLKADQNTSLKQSLLQYDAQTNLSPFYFKNQLDHDRYFFHFPKVFSHETNRAGSFGVNQVVNFSASDLKDTSKFEAILASGHEIVVAVDFNYNNSEYCPGQVRADNGQAFRCRYINNPDAAAVPSSDPGTHALLLVGYDRYEKYFIFKNSWSDGWGMGSEPHYITDPATGSLILNPMGGYGRFDYDVIANHSLSATFVDGSRDPAQPTHNALYWLGIWRVEIDGVRGILVVRNPSHPNNHVGDFYLSGSTTPIAVYGTVPADSDNSWTLNLDIPSVLSGYGANSNVVIRLKKDPGPPNAANNHDQPGYFAAGSVTVSSGDGNPLPVGVFAAKCNYRTKSTDAALKAPDFNFDQLAQENLPSPCDFTLGAPAAMPAQNPLSAWLGSWDLRSNVQLLNADGSPVSGRVSFSTVTADPTVSGRYRITGTYRATGSTATVALTAYAYSVQPHQLTLTLSAGTILGQLKVRYITLLMHRNDRALVSGWTSPAVTNSRSAASTWSAGIPAQELPLVLVRPAPIGMTQQF